MKKVKIRGRVTALFKFPDFKDENKNRTAHFLFLVICFALPGSLVILLVSIIFDWHEGVTASLTGFPLFIASFLFMHFKKLQTASLITLLALLLAALISIYYGTNIYDSALLIIPIVIILSGFLLQGVSFTIFSFISLLLFTADVMLSWHNFQKLPRPGTFYGRLILTLIFFTFILTIMKFFINYLVAVIEKSKINEEKFRTFTEKLEFGIFTYTEDGYFNYANDYASKMMGYSREELTRKKYIEFIHPDYRKLVEERAKARLSGENAIDNYELKVIFKDGSVHWVTLSANRINIQGKPLGLAGVFEITRRKELEQQLMEEKEQLLVTLRSIGDGVIVTDVNGSIVLLNRVAEKLTGWKTEAASGKALKDIFKVYNKLTGEELQNPVNRVKVSESVFNLTDNSVLISRDESEILIADSCAPIRDRESRIIGTVIVFRDITEKKKIEEQLEKARKLESLGILAGGIAHDFNNLLTGILGNISLMQMYLEGNSDSRLLESIKEAKKAAKRAGNLTQQLLTFSKGGSPILEVASLDSIIRENASFILSGSNVGYTINSEDNLWKVNIDTGQISQVIQNLVLNADQAMPHGGRIEINTRNISLGETQIIYGVNIPKGDYVSVEITDQGAGIPEEIQDKIYDPYFTTKETGNGLGLSTVYSIIKQHKCYIGFESYPGKGTTFYLYFPIADSGQIKRSRKEIKTAAAYNEPKALSGTVLIMDDEESVRKVAARMLKKLNFTADTAADGREALEKYRESMETGKKYNIVLLDLTVPGGMGGKETAAKILGIDHDACIIATSGYSNDPIMANYEDYGFKTVLKKPYDFEEIKSTIAGLLK